MQPRSDRHSFNGFVRLLLPFEPWRLMISLQGANLSESGLLARYTCRSDKQREAASLFVPGECYDLQLDHPIEHLPAPHLPAVLQRIEERSGGIELGFAFDEPNADLLSLVHELH